MVVDGSKSSGVCVRPNLTSSFICGNSFISGLNLTVRGKSLNAFNRCSWFSFGELLKI